MRERVLISGGAGFVGRHLVRLLAERAVPTAADVTAADALAEAIRAARPDAVVHLAAAASAGASWDSGARREVWRVNVLGTVNVLDAVAAEAPDARVVVASSGEVYGDTGDTAATEDTALAPVSPYAASKAAAEVACERARRVDGLDVVVARPFPHIGPGQDERFAVGSWVRQVARLEQEGGGALRVGNLEVRRDVTDVRDVCRAYALLLDPAVPAGVYNVTSERAVTMGEITERLSALAGRRVTVEQDPSRLRPADVRTLRGDAAKLRDATGWRAETTLDRSLADALDDARRAASEQAMAP